jgi:hypothetical protein
VAAASSSTGGEAGEDIQSGQGGGFFRRCRWRRKRLKGSPFRIESGANAVFQGRRRFVPSEDLAGTAKRTEENASVEKRRRVFPLPECTPKSRFANATGPNPVRSARVAIPSAARSPRRRSEFSSR